MMYSYADKLEKYDNKFLSASDLLELKGSTYWDIGTNGYRLEYINVYDRYKHFYRGAQQRRVLGSGAVYSARLRPFSDGLYP